MARPPLVVRRPRGATAPRGAAPPGVREARSPLVVRRHPAAETADRRCGAAAAGRTRPVRTTRTSGSPPAPANARVDRADSTAPQLDQAGGEARGFYDEPVTETLPPAGIDLSYIERLQLVEAEDPPPAPVDGTARDRVRDEGEAPRADPVLLGGPAVACGGPERTDPRVVRLPGVRLAARRDPTRRVSGATALPPWPVNLARWTDDGRAPAARMPLSTAAPSPRPLPGGPVRPPADSDMPDESALAGRAGRKPVEESWTGVRTREAIHRSRQDTRQATRQNTAGRPDAVGV